MHYVAESISRKDIRELSLKVRKLLYIDDIIYFPVLNVLEIVMPLLFDGFQYEIAEISEMPKNKHAETDVVNKIIRIREDIYEGAVNGNGRDRMTITHEIAHYILIVLCGVKFNRAFGDAPIKTYKDPEWQAKAVAGELMCPQHLITNMTLDEVVSKCGISPMAAKYNLGLCKGGDAN